MSKRSIIVVFLMFFILSMLKAQDRLNYKDVDVKSYELFIGEKWPELIEFSSEARKQGIDFYYLQVRTGIAWYNQKRYRNASEWFLKAYSNDTWSEWLQEYLYYSLLFSGRILEANKHAGLFSEEVKEKIGFRPKEVTRFAYETGYSFNPDFENLKTHPFSTEINLGSDYGEGYFFKNYSFHSFDLSHRINPNFMLNHNFTYIKVNREAVINWAGQTSSPAGVNQYQYFINPVWVIGKKLNISSSLNLIFGSRDIYTGYERGSVKTWYLAKSNYTDFVFSTAVWSDYGNFSPGLEINAGNLNNSQLTQISTWITYYPLSNSRLYFTPRVYFNSGSGTNGFGYSAMGISGGMQFGPIHFYGESLFGEMENFIESGGYVISNFPGKSDRKLMGSVYFPVGKKCQIVFRYINRRMTEKYQAYSNGVKSNFLEYHYSQNTTTGGISWNF